MISEGNFNNLKSLLYKVTEFDILHHYFNISKVPIVISSPLRSDKNPSFAIYTINGNRIYWKDLSTMESGGVLDLLGKYWNANYYSVVERISKDISSITSTSHSIDNLEDKITTIHDNKSNSDLECKVREWKDYDIKYWEGFGINLQWLKYADIYPISHKIVIKDNKRYIFGAEKYAYAYVEGKDGKVTLKIYQPFSKKYKWCSKHNKSVISLWTKVPNTGENIIICSSMKDALCVWANTNIPCIAVQGEGYVISNTALENLKSRYKNIYILFDNDAAGLEDGVKLSKLTGFINLVLPDLGAKDCSDLFKLLKDKEKFKEIIFNLIKKQLIKTE